MPGEKTWYRPLVDFQLAGKTKKIEPQTISTKNA
jgi:hypothetical protein